jgi:glyoxylase-like metal-dependent hydrolase (beta-lactamase superfamily II)
LLNIKRFKTGNWQENCYIVQNSSNDGLIVDPGENYDEISEYINKNNINVLAIINTHAHYDHIGAVSILKDTLEIPFYLHSKDSRLLKSANLYSTLFDGEQKITVPSIDHFLDDCNQPLIFKDIEVTVIETPGHTKGSVCFQIDNYLFTGDTIFEKEIGRVDLPGGDKEDLKNSLKKLSKLPASLRLYPGHGNPTTMQRVLDNNQKLRELL